MPTRFSPLWTKGEGETFSRILGSHTARPVNHEDPIHTARLARYRRNIEYFTQTQYDGVNASKIENRDFLELRVN